MAIPMGELIIPSSVAGSGVSVSASGKVTFTAATEINVNGVFSSTYDNYVIVSRYKYGGNNNAYIRLRGSGTDVVTGYVNQYVNADGTSVTGARLSTGGGATYWYVNYGGTTEQGRHFYLYGPALSQPTAFRSVGVSSYNTALIEDFASTQSTSSGYDGFTWYHANSTMTGSLTVYGLSQ
jgi:hypothetical protein